MEQDDIFNDPIVRAAFAKKQEQAIALQAQQQAYFSKFNDIEKSKMAALSQIDADIANVPDAIKSGAGIQWDVAAQKKRIAKAAELARIEMNPAAKGTAEARGIINDKYPEKDLQPFQSTDTYKQAERQFTNVINDYRIADILNEQLGTLGNILVQSREAKDENTKKALDQQARQYAIASIAQNFANASQPNAQQLNEFLRAAPDLLTPEQIGVLGGNYRAMFGSAVQKLRNSKPGSDEENESIKTVKDGFLKIFSSDPEAWYKVAQLGNKDIQSQKAKALKERVVSKVGPWHADEMGAVNPIVLDPLVEYMAKSRTEGQGFAQVENAPSGFSVSKPVQQGTMQSGTVSSGTMMPTSRPRTRYTVLTPQ